MRVAQVRLSPTIESMSSYLKDYPSSPETSEIRVKLRPLLLAEALSQSGKIQVLETDLRRYYDFVEREIIPMAPAGSGRFPETLIAYAGEAQDLHALNSFREELEQAKSRGARRSWR